VRNVGRRTFVKFLTASLVSGPAILKASVPRRSDVRIENVVIAFKNYKYRVPIKFGGIVSDRITLLNVVCTIRSKEGKVATGFGQMPLSNTWSFPSRTLSYDTTLAAMKKLAERIATITRNYTDFGHPIELNWVLEPQYLKAAQAITSEEKIPEPIPALCTLVTASAFDAAMHDAYGKLHGLNCYSTYGPEFMNRDLSYYLGPEYRGQYPNDYVSTRPKDRMPMYHLVSAIDPIVESDITHPIKDGLPETLPQWIDYNGLTHFKIKLDGDDLHWDVARVLTVDRVVTETERKRGVRDFLYSLDFNERCPNVEYLINFLSTVKQKSPEGFARIQYVEQPTARDLDTHRQNVMFAAAKLKPIVIDESLTGLHALMLSREMGYTGAALKACKGQSNMMILAPVMEKNKMFLCVQDLTCPAASLIQSASLAAHVPGVKAIEANARQFVPAASEGWEKRFPGIFHVTDGTMDTSGLNGLGIGAVAPGQEMALLQS
jgi:L-alanine-DL-glutamate epimerase-like enolase superfamily enzyme